MIQITAVRIEASDHTGFHGLCLGSTQSLNSNLVYRLLWQLSLNCFLAYHHQQCTSFPRKANDLQLKWSD